MSDDPQTPPPDGGSDASFPGLSETELDHILAQAGLLADQLSAELGRDPSASDLTASEPASHTSHESTSLDDELAQLDALVAAATDDVKGGALAEPPPVEKPHGRPDSVQRAPEWVPEADEDIKNLFPGGKLPPAPPPEAVQQAMTPPEHRNLPTRLTDPRAQTPAQEQGATAPSAEESSSPTADEKPQEGGQNESDDEIPDFMREFMEPEPDELPDAPVDPGPADPAPVIEATRLPVQMKPGVVGTGMLHKVVRPEPLAKPEETTEEEQEEEEATSSLETVTLSRKDLFRARMRRLLRLFKRIPSPVPALSAIAYVGCEKVVALLERVDRPTHGVDYRLRVLIGWVTLATLGTAVVVYLISLL